MNAQAPNPEEARPTAAELFDIFKAGYQALGTLLDEHRDYLRRIVKQEITPQLLKRADVSDIVQEANLDVFEHVQRETGGLFAVEQGEDLKAWLRRVLVNALLNKRRYEGQKIRDANQERPLPEGHDLTAAGPSASSIYRGRERNEILERAINRLDDDAERLLLRLRYWHGWSCPQLAQLREGQATEAARMRMQRRLAELEFRLGEDDEVQKLGE